MMGNKESTKEKNPYEGFFESIERMTTVDKEERDLKRLDKLHQIVETCETELFIGELNSVGKGTLEKWQKSLALPDGWIELEPTERAKLFRKHIFTNGAMLDYCRLVQREVAKLDKETRWDLFLFFYPDAKREKEFFPMIKNFDIALNSWVYYSRLFAYLEEQGYQKRGDIHYSFTNIAITLRDFLIKEQEYYLAHPNASVLEARHLHEEQDNYLHCLSNGVFEKELLSRLDDS